MDKIKTELEYDLIDEDNFEQDFEDDEIEFDDNIDIDVLQAKLQQFMAQKNIDYRMEKSQVKPAVKEEIAKEAPKSATAVVDKPEPMSIAKTEVTDPNPVTVNKPDDSKEKLSLKPGERKYVVYITSENIDYIESLSVKDRKNVINRLIHEDDIVLKRKKAIRERVKFTNHIIIMVLTVVVALPLFFILLNKSIEVTVLNYQQAQQNFVKLYREQGKIKSYKKFQKTFQ